MNKITLFSVLILFTSSAFASGAGSPPSDSPLELTKPYSGPTHKKNFQRNEKTELTQELMKELATIGKDKGSYSFDEVPESDPRGITISLEKLKK